MVPPWTDTDLSDESLAAAGERMDQPRLEDVLIVSMTGVLVLPEGVDRALPRENAGMHRPRIHLSDLAVKPFDPTSRPHWLLVLSAHLLYVT